MFWTRIWKELDERLPLVNMVMHGEEKVQKDEAKDLINWVSRLLGYYLEVNSGLRA